MQNRIAFVTGASRGIGRACALALSKAGARVVVAARQVEKLEHVAAEIRSGGGDAFVVPIDMSAPDSIRSAFDKAAKDKAVKPVGEWNTLECVCDSDNITNILNGKVVNAGTQSSLTRGKILFQSEGAEVFFRRIDLRPLKK